jgi:hypothetical protein|tara:strand:- start:1637 stop:1846 length:210 start_codon:yes stop_codon:yes gene_type:complete
MTSDEKIDGLDAIIEDLVEWELSSMDYKSLQDYYFEDKKEHYYDNPESLENMLKYREEYNKTEIVLGND